MLCGGFLGPDAQIFLHLLAELLQLLPSAHVIGIEKSLSDDAGLSHAERCCLGIVGHISFLGETEGVEDEGPLASDRFHDSGAGCQVADALAVFAEDDRRQPDSHAEKVDAVEQPPEHISALAGCGTVEAEDPDAHDALADGLSVQQDLHVEGIA